MAHPKRASSVAQLKAELAEMRNALAALKSATSHGQPAAVEAGRQNAAVLAKVVTPVEGDSLQSIAQRAIDTKGFLTYAQVKKLNGSLSRGLKLLQDAGGWDALVVNAGGWYGDAAPDSHHGFLVEKGWDTIPSKREKRNKLTKISLVG